MKIQGQRFELSEEETAALHPMQITVFERKDCEYVYKVASVALNKVCRSQVEAFEEIRLKCNEIDPRMDGVSIAFASMELQDNDQDLPHLLRIMAVTEKFLD